MIDCCSRFHLKPSCCKAQCRKTSDLVDRQSFGCPIFLMFFRSLCFTFISTGNTDEALRDHSGRSGCSWLATAGWRMLGEAMVWRQRSLTRRDYLILPIGCWGELKEGRAPFFSFAARDGRWMETCAPALTHLQPVNNCV